MAMLDPNVVEEITNTRPGGKATVHAYAPDRDHSRAVLKAMGGGTALDVTAVRTQRKIDPNR